MYRFKPRHQFGHKGTDLEGVEVACLLGHLHDAGHNLVMALLLPRLKNTTSAADLNRKFLAGCVTNKLAGLLLHILGGAGGLVHGLTYLRALAITDLLHGLVAFPHGLVEGLLLEGDGASLLEVLLAHLLLAGLELGDVGVVTLLHVLVGALQDGLLLQGGNLLLLLDAAQSGVWILRTPAEVDASLRTL